METVDVVVVVADMVRGDGISWDGQVSVVVWKYVFHYSESEFLMTAGKKRTVYRRKAFFQEMRGRI